MGKTTLKDLEIGDIFSSVSNKALTFVVRGNCVFNRGHGSSTRACTIRGSFNLISKSCRMEVIKTGESAHKENYKLNPLTL